MTPQLRLLGRADSELSDNAHIGAAQLGESVKLCGVMVQASPNFWLGFGGLLMSAWSTLSSCDGAGNN